MKVGQRFVAGDTAQFVPSGGVVQVEAIEDDRVYFQMLVPTNAVVDGEGLREIPLPQMLSAPVAEFEEQFTQTRKQLVPISTPVEASDEGAEE